MLYHQVEYNNARMIVCIGLLMLRCRLIVSLDVA